MCITENYHIFIITLKRECARGRSRLRACAARHTSQTHARLYAALENVRAHCETLAYTGRARSVIIYLCTLLASFSPSLFHSFGLRIVNCAQMPWWRRQQRGRLYRMHNARTPTVLCVHTIQLCMLMPAHPATVGRVEPSLG